MKHLQGFSLIELVVVILIIATVGVGVSVSVGNFITPEKRLQSEGDDLYQKMLFAQEEALIKQRIIGLRMEYSDKDEVVGYSWHEYENKKWQQLEHHLESVSIKKEIIISIKIEDVFLEALLEEQLNRLEEDENLPPHVLFFPSGEVSEFEMQIALDDNDDILFRIDLNERGELTRDW